MMLQQRRQPLAIIYRVHCNDRRRPPLFTATTLVCRINSLKEARRPSIRHSQLSNMRPLQYKQQPQPLQQIKDVNNTSNNKMRQRQRLPLQRLLVLEGLGAAAARVFMAITLTVISVDVM